MAGLSVKEGFDGGVVFFLLCMRLSALDSRFGWALSAGTKERYFPPRAQMSQIGGT